MNYGYKRLAAAILLLAATLLLYGNTLTHEYTLDDGVVIHENEYTLSGFKGIKEIFSEEMFNGVFGLIEHVAKGKII